MSWIFHKLAYWVVRDRQPKDKVEQLLADAVKLARKIAVDKFAEEALHAIFG